MRATELLIALAALATCATAARSMAALVPAPAPALASISDDLGALGEGDASSGTTQGAAFDIGEASTAAPQVPTPLNVAGRYVAAEVVSYTQLQGDYSWQSDQIARAAGLELILDTDGQFSLSMPDTWWRTLSGPTSSGSDGRYFTGFNSYSTTNGNSFVRLDCIASVYDGRPYLYIAQSAGLSMYATVNDIDFSTGTSSMYEVIVLLALV